MKRGFFILLILAVAMPITSLSQDKKESKETKTTTKSISKEVQLFHKLLHPLVHDALPKGDFAKIREDLEKLLKGATAIQEAQIPKKLAGRQKEVTDAANELVSQLTDMVSTKDKIDDATLEKLFNDMHEKYEQLAEIVK